ncbi:MAG: hypothetical protein IIB44_08315 [Candidatus Marinimicrobia bacterium]|nr:hypothetical protein [Candidatus Neomarinimicrobiota bacterium]MCH8069999.1 hypothetical protein [Candidatus Neomarinimicrobiota bacterium]
MILRSLQVASLLVVLSGLYWGIRESNLILEVQALAVGAVLFFAAQWGLQKWVK